MRLFHCTAVFVLLLLLIFACRCYAEGLDVVWGSMPDVRIVGSQRLAESDYLNPGDYWSVAYEIKVKKWFWEGEDVVRQRIMEHLERILGKVKKEHPEIWIFYAEYRYVKKECDWFGDCDYHYTARIVGKVMTLEEMRSVYGEEASKVKLNAVMVAVILALILGCIVSTIVLVNQPSVSKLLIAAGSAAQSFPWVVPLAVGAFIVVLIAIVVLAARKG